MTELMRLKPDHKKTAARVFARAFFDYPMITSYFPDLSRRSRYIEWYWGCVINYGLRYGEVYQTPDTAGISIWLPPGQTFNTTWHYIMAGFLPLPFVFGIKQYPANIRSDDLVIKIHQEIMPGPHWYLWAIAVDPDRQGQGLGRTLMQPGLEKADAQNLPCYLETHAEKDIPFYHGSGFYVVRIEQVPDSDLRFWCMRRDARSS